MRRHLPMSRISPNAHRVCRILAVLGLVIASLGPTSRPVAAADSPTMEARVLLGGNARVGSWMAIAVHLVNNGPAVSGELRIAGGTQGQTRFGTAVDLPTQSDKSYVIYAQPPAFVFSQRNVLPRLPSSPHSPSAIFSLGMTTMV